MKFFHESAYLTGVSVPLAALRSQQSTGIGEFPDLALFAQVAAQTGLEVIQLLPVNDTGFSTSPYNALSAFALHPVYLRLADLPEADKIKAAILQLREDLDPLPRAQLDVVWGKKLPLLRQLYESAKAKKSWTKEKEAWLAERPWGLAYVVFSALRARYLYAGWQSWPENREPAGSLERLFQENSDEAGFYVWLQIHAERQFQAATQACHLEGVAVKGDIPILLNEDSADVWSHPELFDLTWRAGSPPDGENPDGQSWGFPSFNWDVMSRDSYAWWRERLAHAAKFYHAYRIDHVLGFFRLWVSSQQNFTGHLGYFRPSQPLRREQLRNLGFDEGRLVWLSEPHIFGIEIRERLGAEAETVVSLALSQVGDEDLYRFKSILGGEKAIAGLPVSEHAKAMLYSWYRNRTLLKVEDGFYPTPYYYTTRAYESLSTEERWNFERLIHEAREASFKLWDAEGRKLLTVLRQATDMLVCAEDLGSIPPSVPGALRDLGILSLRVLRWARNWDAPGQPYYPVQSYPDLSVTTPSVHDTSTLRQWWSDEPEHGACSALGIDHLEGAMTPEVARRFFAGLLTTQSRLCIVPLQDWFLLESSFLEEDPAQERINVPGTVSSDNWSYRMKPSLEDLLSAQQFISTMQGLLKARKHGI